MATTPLSYTGTDPKKIAQSNRSTIYGQGQQLTAQQQQAQQEAEARRGSTAGYLDQLEAPLASGAGGYNADETSQIEYSPEDQQNLINNAGISAGVNTAASVGAAQRAADAAGGNPAALMAYRARAAQQQGVNAGNAMTGARVAAKTAEQGGATTVGNARLGQQTQGLQYYQGQNDQANTNAQQDLGLQGQTYGTTTSGINSSANTAQSASQNPTTFDKVMGGVSGALSFLEDGSPGGGTDAVIAEDGPEKVVDMSGHDYMADGGFSGDLPDDAMGGGTTPTLPGVPAAGGSQPWWKKLTSNTVATGGGGQPQQQKQWNPTTTYSDIGKDVGKIASVFLEDGGFRQGDNGIFTEATRVKLGPEDGVVPLSYRASAKIRPSMAALPAARTRQPYGSAHA